jgi:hypothetical protein
MYARLQYSQDLGAAAGSNELHLRLVHFEGCCERLELSNCDGRVFGSRVNICSRVLILSSNRMRSTERDLILESAHGAIEKMISVKCGDSGCSDLRRLIVEIDFDKLLILFEIRRSILFLGSL